MQSQEPGVGAASDPKNDNDEGTAAIAGSRSSLDSPSVDGNLTAAEKGSVQHFILDKAKPLDPATFPNQPLPGNTTPPVTIPNVSHFLASYGITTRYNTITKKVIITMPGQAGTPDNADNVALAQIISLATLNGLSAGQVPSYVYTIADRNQFNPIASWILSKPWDGIDRLPLFYATLTERAGYPREFKEKLMYRWELSAVAAALKPSGFRSRGALTLQGPQGLGKTTWVGAHVPDPQLRDQTIKLDHHMDAGNKDSQIAAICHWMVEIGELDSSFKKDVARLKGFLTSDRDKVRRPYARVASEYPRRTVFCATVNDRNFLVDNTGNSRWWTVPVIAVNYQHGIDMQQLFAQLAVDFHNGAQWWLTQEEEQLLEAQNKTHRSVSAIWERVHSALDLNHPQHKQLPAMKAIEVLIQIGVKNPTNSQCKECAAALREYLGEPKEINGFFKWRVPLMQRYEDALTPPSMRIEEDDDRF